MSIKIFIHAVNVHQGGGRKLLEGLLGAIESDKYEYILNLDSRLSLTLKEGGNITVRRIRPTIIQRFMAEVWLLQNARIGDRVLCFGNLPPLFKLEAFTSVYLQNRYLIDSVDLSGFTAWSRVRITLERLWFRYAQLNANEYLVQTASMQNLMNIQCHKRVPVNVHPFAVKQVLVRPQRNGMDASVCEFVYVASGEPHKNHRKLLDAWCILAGENIYPKLVLTVDKKSFQALWHLIDEKKKAHNLCVENLGSVSSGALTDVYAKTGALIYPSTFESLGLPLIEADQAGIPILASELDYVRDVVNPVQTFNPESAISIAKAVKRFLGVTEVVVPVESPATFMRQFLSGVN